MHELTDNLLITYHGECFCIAPSNALDMRKVHAPHQHVDPPWRVQSNASTTSAPIKQLPTYLADMSSFKYLMLYICIYAQRLTLADAVAEI